MNRTKDSKARVPSPVDLVADQVAIRSHESGCRAPNRIVYSADVSPECAAKQVSRNRLEEDLIVVPDGVQTRFLREDDSSSSCILMVQRRDMCLGWRSGLQWLLP